MSISGFHPKAYHINDNSVVRMWVGIKVGLLLNKTKWHLVSPSLVPNGKKCHLVLVLPN